MSEYMIIPTDSIDATADAIKAKLGSQNDLEWGQDGFADAINAISVGASVTDVLMGNFPSGVYSFKATGNLPAGAIAGRSKITELTIDLTDDYIISGYAIRYNSGTFSRLILQNASSYNDPTVNKKHGSYAITDNNGIKQIIIRGTSRAFDASGMRPNTALQVVDIEKAVHPTNVATLGNNAFYGCSALNVLILRQTNEVVVITSSTFTNTPFASGNAGGTLYVPNSMISSYQSASNWSTILGYANNSIVKLEDSPYESLTWYQS